MSKVKLFEDDWVFNFLPRFIKLTMAKQYFNKIMQLVKHSREEQKSQQKLLFNSMLELLMI